MTEPPFSTIEEALEDIRAGKMVVVCDAEDRENEGDLTLAAQFATPENINFMAREAPRPDLPGAHARALRRARPRPDGGQERVGVRDRVHGLGRGARGSHDRHLGARPGAHDPGRDRPALEAGRTSSSRATSSRSRRARGGVLERTGQTEAGVDLARLAGLIPAAVICEIMNDDGTMARVKDLVPYCERHGLKMITVGGPDQVPPPHRAARRASRRGRTCRPSTASSTSSATARCSTTSTTSRWSRATCARRPSAASP